MQELLEGKILKVITPFQFLLQDAKDKASVKIQVKATKNQSFQHLLPVMFSKMATYQLQKKKSNKIREQSRKGVVYLQGEEITSLYKQSHAKQYIGNEISTLKTVQCFVSKVECLKVQLISLKDLKYITFYFSQLKLIRVGNIHPKQMWERSQQYFKSQMGGQFVTLKISGSQNYKEEVNIFGDIIRIRDGVNIRTKTIADGYAQLSKDSQKYLSQQMVKYYYEAREKAKSENAGFWQTSKNITKSNNQVQEFKYRQWQQWLKQGKQLSKLKNQDQEFKVILEELNKMSKANGKIQHNKIKMVLDVLIMLFQDQFSKRYLRFLEDVVKSLCVMVSNMQIPFYQQLDNLDYIKSLNKVIVYLIFHHQELQKLIQQSKGQKILKNSSIDLQKCIKFIFKLCFLGNQTFTDKIFGKHKENKYQSFNFENAYLQGGFSSLSQCSDYQQGDKLSKQQRKQKKISSAQQKIRINSTQLLSNLFQHYPNIVENYWQLCVTSNILTKDFLGHVKKLRITTSQVKMNAEQKKQVANLMRSNFGQHSLILLSIFQKSNKVKLNSVICLLNMISNFQGKKLIATTQSSYIQKLLKQTKSSFVPKSYIVFSALRNALYFLLFALYYQKNLQIVISIFKTLCQLCNNSSLIDKMSFQEGIGLLLRNYIVPVLEFEWGITQLEELKTLCINFLGVLVNNNRRWQEIEANYLKSQHGNINKKLMQVVSQRLNRQNKINEDKVIVQIVSYFTKLAKSYFSVIFYRIEGALSIWQYMKETFMNRLSLSYSLFVQQIFKGYLDQHQAINTSGKTTRLPHSIKMEDISEFLKQFLRVYSLDVTPANYVHILGTLTYIDYNQWSKPEFEYVKSFTIHCFESFVNSKASNDKFQSIEPILNNTLIRVTLIKLLGYLSFCPQFQTSQITKKAVNYLQQLSKQYKSFNSLVKISWGLSNWAKTPNFSIALNEKQLKSCLDYLMSHSQSDKQKIASNCTRGIGFFVSNVGKKFNLKECRQHIIKNLTHTILKVRTNSTKTLTAIAQDLSEKQIKQLLPVLQQNILRNNYHLQMQTLQLLKKIGNPIEPKRLLGLFVSILKNLMNYTTLQYEFSQIKTICELRFTVLTQIFEIKEQIMVNQELRKDILAGICQFLVKDCNQKHKKHEENSKTLGKWLQKSEEPEQQIFKQTKIKAYNQQKIIESEGINKEVIYTSSPQQLKLLNTIKQFYLQQREKLDEEWNRLQTLRIQGDIIYIDLFALRMSDSNEQIAFIAKQ